MLYETRRSKNEIMCNFQVLFGFGKVLECVPERRDQTLYYLQCWKDYWKRQLWQEVAIRVENFF